MDREALVLRNRKMAEAFHATPLKHQARHALLRMISLVPGLPVPSPSTERILLIRPDHLGDLLLTTPAIHALRKARPNAEIHALVGPWSAEVLAAYPEVDLVLTLPFPGFSRTPKESLGSPYEMAVSSSRNLRKIGYSSAVILRPDHWWGAMMAKMAGIKERIGYDSPDVVPFLSKVLPQLPKTHAVMQNLKLVEGWTGNVLPDQSRFYFPVESRDQAYIDGYLDEWGVKPQQPIFCIHPGTGSPNKHWQEERWAQVADILSEQLDARVVFTGGPHEMPLAQRIIARMKQPAILTVGDTRVGQLAALFKRARVVLGPDSGPLHLAVAVGTPTVALFGPADPAEFGSWGASDKHFILASDIGCRPCRVLDWHGDDPQYHPCMRDITIAQVLDAARQAAATRRGQ